MRDPVRYTRTETLIEGGRRLYNYTFVIDEDPSEEPVGASNNQAEEETNE